MGTYGTLIGAGGGFVLMPVLLLLYPKENPDMLAAISLAVVFFNALSGSWAYARQGKIDYSSGISFSSATIPGAIIGALTTYYIPRHIFDGILGILLLAVSIYLLMNPRQEHEQRDRRDNPFMCTKTVTDCSGHCYTYCYNRLLGMGISFLVGFLSSMLGIGGGIIHVPVLVRLLNFPVHVATATSHFILMIMSLVGTIVHLASGTFSRGLRRTICLSIGVLIGAQLGAFLSDKVRGRWILRGLAIALFLVGLRIIFKAFLG